MLINKGFTPVTIVFDRAETERLVDGFNMLTQQDRDSVNVLRLLIEAGILDTGTTTGKVVINDVSPDKRKMVRVQTTITLDLLAVESWDMLMADLRAMIKGLSPDSQSRRVNVNDQQVKGKPLDFIQNLHNQLCNVNNPPKLTREQ